jgi:hypothetical protein
MKRAIVPASAILMAAGAKESINGQVWHKTKSGIRWRVHVIALVCVVVICVAPLSARAQRVVTLSNIPSKCGGSLKVTGTGFGHKNNNITIKATAPKGSTLGSKSVKTTAVDEDFSILIPYAYLNYPAGPGCYTKVRVTVLVTGDEGNKESGAIDLPAGCAAWGGPYAGCGGSM